MANDDRLNKSVTLIKDLRPGMKNVTCLFLVIDKGTVSHTKDGSVVRKCRVADKSASICFSLWNEQAAAIEGGDILRLTKGYASLWKGSMVLYSGKYGKLEKIGEFSMVYSETPNMSDSNHDFAQRGQPPSAQNPPPGGSMGPRPPPPTDLPRGGSGGSNGGGGAGGGSGGALPGNGNGGSAGRIGNGLSSVSGNWNGNNHLSDGRPLPGETPPTSLVGQHHHDPSPLQQHHPSPTQGLSNGGSGTYPPYHQKHQSSVGHHEASSPHHHHHHDTSNGSPNFRAPLKPPYSSSSTTERYHPYHRPSLTNHAPDPRLAWR